MRSLSRCDVASKSALRIEKYGIPFDVMPSATNLVEIDLLRQWTPVMQLPESLQTHYRILVSASIDRPRASVYTFTIREPIPAFPLPLQEGDTEPTINIQGLLNDIYDQSGYDLVIDYRDAPTPPLAPADSAWLTNWLSRKA